MQFSLMNKSCNSKSIRNNQKIQKMIMEIKALLSPKRNNNINPKINNLKNNNRFKFWMKWRPRYNSNKISLKLI